MTRCGKRGKWESHNILFYSCKTSGQEATVQTGHSEKNTGSRSAKEMRLDCTLSPWLFNLYVEYIIREVEQEKKRVVLNLGERKISNLCNVDDATLIAENANVLQALIMKVMYSFCYLGSTIISKGAAIKK